VVTNVVKEVKPPSLVVEVEVVVAEVGWVKRRKVRAQVPSTEFKVATGGGVNG
jgi:hypothetical protein